MPTLGEDLITAAKEGDNEKVIKLLKSKADPNAKDNDGSTALHWAARKGHAAVVTALVQAGADLKTKDLFGNTALHWAARKGHAAVVTALVQAGADLKASNQHGNTALHYAAEQGHAAVVTALVEKGGNPDRPNRYTKTALILAAANGHAAVVTTLVKAGADLEGSSQNGNTALHWAADKGHAAVVTALLEKVANPNTPNQHGDTALHLAAARGHAAVVTALLKAEAGLEARDSYGNTALHWAALNGHAVVVTALLDAGANPEATNDAGSTALHWAAKNGHAAVVQLLLVRGAAVNKVDGNGHTALCWADRKGYEVVVEYLKGFKTLADLDSGFVTTVNKATKERIDEIRAKALTSPEPEPEPELEFTEAGEEAVSSKAEVKDHQLEQLKCISLKKIAGSLEEQQVVKYKNNFITLALVVARLMSYEGSRPVVAREIIDNIIKLTKLGKIFSPDGAIVGIGDVIMTLSDDNYAEVFKPARFFGRTRLQEVISDVSRMVGGKSYPDPDSFAKLKEGLDPERKSLTKVAQTDSKILKKGHQAHIGFRNRGMVRANDAKAAQDGILRMTESGSSFFHRVAAGSGVNTTGRVPSNTGIFNSYPNDTL